MVNKRYVFKQSYFELVNNLVNVIKKLEIRQWENPRGKGKVLTFEVIDSSCDLRLSAFNQYAEK